MVLRFLNGIVIVKGTIDRFTSFIPIPQTTMMFKNNLLTIFRCICQRKDFSILNVREMCGVLALLRQVFLFLYFLYELRCDDFHEKRTNISSVQFDV
jgi:hypothetical protein